MPDDDLLPEPAPDLVQDLKRGNVVAVVGSGLSCAAGLPGWVELIQGICDEAWGTHTGQRQVIADAWQEVGSGQLLDAANLLKDILGPAFAGAVGRQLLRRRTFQTQPESLARAVAGETQKKPWTMTEGPRDVDPWPTASHRILMRLNLRCVITTNYDNLLERAIDDIATYSWSSAEVPNLLAAHKRLVLKIHGDLDHPRDIIAARVDYVRSYVKSPTRNALESLLKSSRPLWIGYGHNDPDLDLILDDMKRLDITGGYAIVPKITSKLRLRLEQVGISVAELPKHSDVPRFLQRLALAAESPVAFTVRYSSQCTNEKAAKRRGVDIERLLEDYGINANVWKARVGAQDCQLEALPPDFRGLQEQLRRADASLFAKLAALGVEVFDQVEIPLAPPPPPPPPPDDTSHVIRRTDGAEKPPPPPPPPHSAGESYTLFCRLLDRDNAWNTLARLCEDKDSPLLFLLHGTPNQHISLFMDRVQLFLADEARDGVHREHQVFEVVFQRDHVRLQTAEEWEASFRRAMGFPMGRPLAYYLQRALTHNAVMFLVRGRDTAPLMDLTPTERDGLRAFLEQRLPAVLAALKAPHRAVRVLVGVEHPLREPKDDNLYKVVHAALRAPGAERKLLELHIPTLDEVEESVERFLSDRGQTLTPALRSLCEVVYGRHEARGDAINYRDLADDLYHELSPLLAAPRT